LMVGSICRSSIVATLSSFFFISPRVLPTNTNRQVALVPQSFISEDSRDAQNRPQIIVRLQVPFLSLASPPVIHDKNRMRSNQRPSGSGRQVPRRVVSLPRSAMIVPSAISKPFLPSSGQIQTCGDSECAKDDACNEMQSPLQPAARVHRWSARNASSEKHVGCPRAFNDVFATLPRCPDRFPRERLQPISCGR
jgi:hypothetical protein